MAATLAPECCNYAELQEKLQSRASKRDEEYVQLLGEGKETDVLIYGLNTRDAHIMQMDAYVSAQRKIEKRDDTAHALLVSANVFTMAVMSSQLAMHRWKVSEAQTLTDATAILEEQIVRAQRSGFMRTRSFVGSKHTKRAASSTTPVVSLGKSCADEMGGVAAETMEIEETDYRAASPCSTVCSGEEVDAVSTLIPPDMLTKLVVIDTFTHEPFSDIVEHLRFIDCEYNLNLVIVLMLHENYSRNTPGVLVLPKHTTTMKDAYNFGCDLVLLRSFDHKVVEFLTNMFISATGRWRNDVRRILAVGNYNSIRHMFLEGMCHFKEHGNQEQNGPTADGEMTRLSPLSTSMMSRTSTPHAVLSPYQQQQLLGGISGSLSHDAFSKYMTPSERVKRGVRRLVRSSGDAEDGEERYEDVLVDESDEMESAIVAACQREIARLLSEVERSERAGAFLREEVVQLKESIKLQQSRRKHSSTLSASENDVGGDMCSNLGKEHQIYLLKRRLQEVVDRLALYEDAKGQPLASDRRDKFVNRNALQRAVVDWMEEEEDDEEVGRNQLNKQQLVWPNNDSLNQYIEALESLVMEREDVNVHKEDSGGGGGGAEKKWHCHPARDPNDLVSTLRAEIATLKRERFERDTRPHNDDWLSDRSENMRDQFFGMKELVQMQKKRIEQLEERLQDAPDSRNKMNKKTGRRKVAHAEESNTHHRNAKKVGEGINNNNGTESKKKRMKRRSSFKEELVSTWDDDTSGHQPVMKQGKSGDDNNTSGDGDWKSRMKAAHRIEIQSQLKRLRREMNEKRIREIELVEAKARAREQAHAKASTNAREALVQLQQILDEVRVSEERGDHEAAETGRAKARVVASVYANNQSLTEYVEQSALRDSSESIAKLHNEHAAAIKTAEDMLLSGCTGTSYAQAVLAARVAAMDLKVRQEANIKKSVTSRAAAVKLKEVTLYGDENVTEEGARSVMEEGEESENDNEADSMDSFAPACSRTLQQNAPALRRYVDQRQRHIIPMEIKAYAAKEFATPLVLLCRAALDDLHSTDDIYLQMIKEELEGCCRSATRHGSSCSILSSKNNSISVDTSGSSINELYLCHHRTLLHLLHVMSKHHSELLQVLQYETAELETKIARELCDDRVDVNGDKLSARFLMAIDTALLSLIADLLDDDERQSAGSSMELEVNATSAHYNDVHKEIPTSVDIAKLMSKENVQVSEIPNRLMDLLEDDEVPSVDVDMTNKMHRELEKIRKQRQSRLKAAAEAVRRRRELLQQVNGSSSSSSSSCASSDEGQSVGSVAADTVTFHPSLRRVLSSSKYRSTVPMHKQHAILQRRYFPSQSLISAKIEGDVAVEVSKRVAHPRFKYRTTTEPNVFCKGNLPPVQPRGFSHEQQRQWKAHVHQSRKGQQSSDMIDVGPAMRGQKPSFDRPFVSTDKVDLSPFSPEELAERIMCYRLEDSRKNPTHRLDASTTVVPTFAIPMAAKSLPPFGEVHPAFTHRRKQGEMFSSWVYGVPQNHLFPMLRAVEPNQSDTVVFLPIKAASEKKCNRQDNVQVHAVCSSFVKRMLTRMDLFASPATLAAQRLNAQLQMSMTDWRMGVFGTNITLSSRWAQQNGKKE